MAASQIDWRVLQQSQTERWLKCARRAFAGESRLHCVFSAAIECLALLTRQLQPALTT